MFENLISATDGEAELLIVSWSRNDFEVAEIVDIDFFDGIFAGVEIGAVPDILAVLNLAMRNVPSIGFIYRILSYAAVPLSGQIGL